MTVNLDTDRVAVELTYDQATVNGETINVKAENKADGDVSTRDQLANDGRFTWTYPTGYAGTTTFTVTGSNSGEDTGTIDVDFT